MGAGPVTPLLFPTLSPIPMGVGTFNRVVLPDTLKVKLLPRVRVIVIDSVTPSTVP